MGHDPEIQVWRSRFKTISTIPPAAGFAVNYCRVVSISIIYLPINCGVKILNWLGRLLFLRYPSANSLSEKGCQLVLHFSY